MSGRVARQLRKLANGDVRRYKFAKYLFTRGHFKFNDVREALEARNDPAAR